MIVDSHLHPISDDESKYPVAPTGGTLAPWGTQPLTGAQVLDHATSAGVSQVVLVQPSGVYGYDNSYVAHQAATSPAFAGVGIIDPLQASVHSAMEQLVADGMAGVRLFPDPAAPMPTLDADPFRPYWESAVRLNFPVCVLVGADQLEALGAVALRYSSIRVVVEHLAMTRSRRDAWFEDTSELVALAAIPNVFLKVTNSNFARVAGDAQARVWLQNLLSAFPPDRLMWGSNFPASVGEPNPYTSLVDVAREFLEFLSPAARDEVFGGTASRMFGFA